MRNTVIAMIASLILSLVGSLFINYLTAKKAESSESKADTVIRTERVTLRDTIFVNLPLPKSEAVKGERVVELPLEAIRGNPVSEDSVELCIPAVSKRYSGEDYEAWVSGIEPQLDSLIIFKTTERISTTEKITIPEKIAVKSRWSVRLTAGMGYWNGKIGPYAGIGVSYRLF